jgi:hypothetical protein
VKHPNSEDYVTFQVSVLHATCVTGVLQTDNGSITLCKAHMLFHGALACYGGDATRGANVLWNSPGMVANCTLQLSQRAPHMCVS